MHAQTRRRVREAGTILTTALIMIVLVTGIVISMVQLSTTDHHVAAYKLSRAGAQAAADAATQIGLEKVLAQATSTHTFPYQSGFDGNVTVGSPDGTANGYRSPRRSIAPENDPVSTDGSGPIPWTNVRYHVRPLRTGCPGAPTVTTTTVTEADGFTTSTVQYHIWATVYLAAGNASADPRQSEFGSITVHRLFNLGIAGLFQYAVFYGGDMEIVHNAPMTVSGRVQVNGNMYLDPLSGNALAFKPVPGTNPQTAQSFVHAAGSMFRSQPNFPSGGGNPTISVTNSSGTPVDVSWPSSLVSGASNWSSTVSAGESAGGFKDQSTFITPTPTKPDLMDGSLGATTVTPPTVDNFQNGGYYDQNAGLNIKYDGTTLTVKNNGVDVTAAVVAAGAITPTTTFWDQRAQATVGTVDIDIGKLNTSGNFPANGLIFASRSDCSTAVPSGIRIKNGATLPAPMTLASPNPVYLQGDFNTAVDANGYPVKSSSIISDALTFQSNSWSDAANTGQRHSSSDNPLNQSGSYTIASEIPTASSTTYNTAFISGNTVSNYAAGQSTLLNPNQSGFSNGGLNNLPRFLEDWSGKTCTISGSMICLFNSQYATAPFSANHYLYHQGSGLSPSKPVNGSIYEPPTRNWGYNPNLMTSPPPFTPVVVSSVEAVYWIN